MATSIATHENPVGNTEANFLIFADLSQWGIDGWEQLWAKRTGEDTFTLCCIPYFTYGIALGDTVRAATAKGRDYVISDVCTKGGRRVVRLWLKNATEDGKDRVDALVREHSLFHEMSSVNLMAIDIPSNGVSAQAVCATLEKIANMYSIDLDYGD